MPVVYVPSKVQLLFQIDQASRLEVIKPQL